MYALFQLIVRLIYMTGFDHYFNVQVWHKRVQNNALYVEVVCTTTWSSAWQPGRDKLRESMHDNLVIIIKGLRARNLVLIT